MMSESTPGGQQQGAAMGDNPLMGDSQETSRSNKKGPYVNNLLEQFEDASAFRQSGNQGPVAGNGQKGSQSVGRGASEIHDDLKTQTAMQRKTGSLGNIHDIQPKQMGVEECTVTTAESVVELQHVPHTFTEKDDTIEVYLYLKEVDKDSLEVKFHPDTVHIKFQTRDAQFLKLCKGSTLKTKFSWTIRLKGQAQEDKCLFKVSSFAVSLNILKKVSGRWGDLENLKRTATKPENSADGEHENAHRRSESKRSVSAENSTKQPEMKTVDDKQVTNLQSDGGNVAPSSDPKITEGSADGGNVAHNSDPMKIEGSAGGGNVAHNSDPKKIEGSAGGGNVAHNSDPMKIEGSAGGGNVAHNSDPKKTEGSAGGGNVAQKSDPKKTEGSGDGGIVSQKSDPKTTEGSGDGGIVSQKSDPKTTEGSGDGGIVSQKSDPKTTEGSGDGGIVSQKSDPKTTEGSGDGGIVSQKSDPKTTEGSGDGGVVSQKSDPKTTEGSGDGGVVSQKSGPKTTEGSGDGGVVSQKSDPKTTEGSGDGGVVSQKSDPKTTEGSGDGGVVSQKSDPKTTEGSGDGGIVSEKSDPKTTISGDGGIVSQKSDPKTTEGSGDGGIVSQKSDPKTTEGSGDGGIVSQKSDPKTTEGSGDGRIVSQKSDPKTTEASGDGGIVSQKSDPKKAEGSADGENVAQSLDPKLTEVSTKHSDMTHFVDKDVKEHVNGPKGSFDTDPTEPSESGSPYTSQNQKQETPNEEDGDTNDKKPDIHQKTSDVRETKKKKENTVQTTPTSQQQSGSDGRHGFPSTNSGTTGGPTDQPVTGTDTEPSQIATTTSGWRMPPPTPEDDDASGATQETLPRGHSNSQDDQNWREGEQLHEIQDIPSVPVKQTGCDGKGLAQHRGNDPLQPERTECVSNVEHELDDGCKENQNPMDESGAKNNTLDLPYRNKAHAAADSENNSSENVVSSDGAPKKQAVEIEQGSYTGESNKSKESQAHSSGKKKTNGTYTFWKDDDQWCILDAKSNNVLTVLEFKADDIYFKGKKIVVVDGVNHTIIEENGAVKLQIVFTQSSLSKKNDQQLLQSTAKSSLSKSAESIPTDVQSSVSHTITSTHHRLARNVLEGEIFDVEVNWKLCDNGKEVECMISGDTDKVQSAHLKIKEKIDKYEFNPVRFNELTHRENLVKDLDLVEEYLELAHEQNRDLHFFVNKTDKRIDIACCRQELIDGFKSDIRKYLNIVTFEANDQFHKENASKNTSVIWKFSGDKMKIIGKQKDLDDICHQAKSSFTETQKYSLLVERSIFKYLCLYGLSEMKEKNKDVIIVPIEEKKNNRFGFMLRSKTQDTLSAAKTEFEYLVNQIKKDTVVSNVLDISKVENFSDSLKNSYNVLAFAHERYTFNKNHPQSDEQAKCYIWNIRHNQLRLSQRCPHHVWKEFLLYFTSSEKWKDSKPFTDTYGKKRMNVYCCFPEKWGMTGKTKDMYRTIVRKALTGAVDSGQHHVCIACLHHVDDKFRTTLLHEIKEFMESDVQLMIDMCFIDKDLMEAYVDAAHKGRIGKPHVSPIDECIDCKDLKKHVDFRKEKIDQCQMDVLVVSIGRDGLMNKGQLSNAILKVAGPGIQHELDKTHSHQDWTVVGTRGYQLPCKKVLHVTVGRYEGKSSIQKLKTLIKQCLSIAELEGYKTIAFPAVGTGNLLYPMKEVSKALMESALEFREENVCCSLDMVYCVIPPSDEQSFKVFEETFEKIRQPPPRPPPPKCRDHKFGALLVDVKIGEVSEFVTSEDSIVYIWDSSEVEKATLKNHSFLQTCGNQMYSDWEKQVKQERQTCVVTGAGNLPANHVIHITKKGHEEIEKCIRRGLTKAKEYNCKHVKMIFDECLMEGGNFAREYLCTLATIASDLRSNIHVSIIINAHFVTEFVYAFNTGQPLLRTEFLLIGEESNLKKAKDTLQKLVSKDMPTVIPELHEPAVQEIDRRCIGESLHSDLSLRADPTLACYVLVTEIKKGVSLEDLLRQLSGLSILTSKVIYSPGRPDAVLKCNSEKEANDVVKRKTLNGLHFSKIPNETLLQKRILCQADIDVEFLDLLDVETVDDEEGKRWIQTRTEYQYQVILEKIKTKTSQTHEQKASEFSNIETVSDVSEQLYELFKNKKETEIQDFESQKGLLTYNLKESLLTIEFENSSDMSSRFDSFKIFLDDVKQMEIGELVADEDSSKVRRWCSEIDEAMKYECCAYICEGNKVITFCKDYNDIVKVKKLLELKQNKRQIKQTGRNRTRQKDEASDANVLDEQKEIPLNRSHRTRSNLENLKIFSTREGIQIMIYKASLLDAKVDCIVNAANEHLSHGAGVAFAIAKKAGRELEEDGNAKVKKDGKIPVGKVVCTKAGRLPYNCVIHAVGPRWSNYEVETLSGVHQCAEDLRSALNESFSAALNKGNKTIALPAISSAIFGVPKDLCCLQYVQAVLDHSKKYQNPLHEIHFVDIDGNTVKNIQDTFESVLQNGTYPCRLEDFVRDNRRFQQRTFNKQNVPDFEPEYNPKPRVVGEMKAFSFSFEHDDTQSCSVAVISVTDKHKLKIYGGDILLDEQADACVNTENYDECDGLLSILVRKMSNREHFLGEKEQALRNNKSPVVSVAGNGCGFKYILFLKLDDTQSQEQNIFNAYKHVFEECMKQNIHSVSTLPLGHDETKSSCHLPDEYVNTIVKAMNCVWKERNDFPIEVRLSCSNKETYFKIKASLEDTPEVQTQNDKEGTAAAGATSSTNADHCVICMDDVTEPKTLPCGHIFCTECIDGYFKTGKQVCPTCFRVVGIVTGDQPYGSMHIYKVKRNCSGYYGNGSIAIAYNFKDGMQQEQHSNPGAWYKGITRTAYLPDNREGKTVCRLLKEAFRRRLIFTIGRSRTTGQEGVITWNDIHHKTDHRPNTQFGYPDSTYLARVTEELAAKGVTEEQINTKEQIDDYIEL
ncbi:uncharacterized protein LOC128211541 [Mya arenaria]|uniref:uncharacterized protein LOC128211541 n=1 Tax=Mya arenaria TaxID=6604 RepID=UPI0022E45C43|nr:uncharacterized protein LOC128211541 [Mya arenaria]